MNKDATSNIPADEQSVERTVKKNTIIDSVVLSLAFLFFSLFSFLMVFTKNDVFVFANFALLISTWIFRKGKYIKYTLAASLPLSNLFTPRSVNIGSLCSFALLIFLIICFVLLIVKRKNDNVITTLLKYKNTIIAFFLFTLYVLIIYFFNRSNTSILKTITGLLYWSIPLLFVLYPSNPNEKKHISKNLLITYSLSLLFSNVYAFFFLYVFKKYGVSFLELFMPSYVFAYTYQNGFYFRFGGLTGDSNGNGFRSLMCVSLFLMMVTAYKKNKLFIVLMSTTSLLLSIFSLLGGSKTFLATFVIILFVTLFINLKNNVQLFIAISGSVFLLFFILLFGNEIVSRYLARILTADLRIGFLDSLTTGRFSILEGYLQYLWSNPLKLMFGNGLRAEILSGYSDSHNLIIQLLWYFGLIGSFLFLVYIFLFLQTNKKRFNKAFLPLIVTTLIYSFSLNSLVFEIWPIVLFIILNSTKQEKKIEKSMVLEARYEIYI